MFWHVVEHPDIQLCRPYAHSAATSSIVLSSSHASPGSTIPLGQIPVLAAKLQVTIFVEGLQVAVFPLSSCTTTAILACRAVTPAPKVTMTSFEEVCNSSPIKPSAVYLFSSLVSTIALTVFIDLESPFFKR